MVQRIPLVLVVFPLWGTPVPKVQATRLSERVVVDVICAICHGSIHDACPQGWPGVARSSKARMKNIGREECQES